MNDDDTPATAAALDTIRAKLARGDDILPADFQSLVPYHHLNSDNNDNNAGSQVPYLNRSFLQHGDVAPQGTTSTSRTAPQLVRYVGMVQDMMDPEYYTSKDINGPSTHFRDAVFVESDFEENAIDNNETMHPGGGADLAERIPLVVVPLPFASEWLLQGMRGEDIHENPSKTSSPKSVAQAFDARKRGRDAEEEEEQEDHNKRERGEETSGDDGMETGGDANITTETTTTAPTQSETQPNDWWPAGTCGSSEKECPVLAKFCYDQLSPVEKQEKENDQPPQQRRLMLNDIVSMVGVLSVNPWEADFSKQQQNQQQGSGNIDEWIDAGWGDDFAPSLPPPSMLPRLHVLSYERLDLEEMAQRAVQQAKKNAQEDESMDVVEDVNSSSATASPSTTCPEAFLSLFDTQSNPKEAKQLAHSLWMCLLSKSDRRSNGSNSDNNGGDKHVEMLRAGPMERALGCLSLQLSMPDLDRSRCLFHHLATNILPAICPIVATIDFTKKQDIVQLGSGPGKDANGRLKPCQLQLPAGSVVLVHYHPNNSAADSGSMNPIKAALRELVQHHRLPYRFEGDVVLPFEADYRVIVVTTQTKQLPCTLSMLSTDNVVGNTMGCGEEALSKLRAMLSLARSDDTSSGTKNDVTLSSSLLERAQADFMSRRRDAYESKQQQQASGIMSSSSLPGEDDFHRWLTLTKIQAMSRHSCQGSKEMPTLCAAEANKTMEATVEDWEIALKLDDASQKAMTV